MRSPLLGGLVVVDPSALPTRARMLLGLGSVWDGRVGTRGRKGVGIVRRAKKFELSGPICI